ncbi:acyltransferase [Rhodobacterales bacterium]|nr:acyltransferase [Rhodobacterales bacterium]
MLVQLQYTRAIAALLVVYFHAVLQIERLGFESDLRQYLFGETGVDLFFVLSGFVMWLTTAGRQIGPLEFYRKRIERIVPLYWLLTLAAAGIALVMPSYLNSTRFDLPHLIASLFFIPWTNAADEAGQLIAPVVIPGWTLNFEMYFYLIFGALLLLAERVRIAALTLVLFVLFLLFNLVPGDSVAARFYGNSIVFEFLAGVVLARLYMAGKLLPEPAAKILLPVAGAGLILFDALDTGIPRIFSAGVPAFLIVFCLVSIDFSKLREVTWLRLVGDASYSLYLTHVFTLVAVRIAYGKLSVDWIENEFVFISICLVASVMVSLVTYRLFEAPIARWLKGVHRRERAVVRT